MNHRSYDQTSEDRKEDKTISVNGSEHLNEKIIWSGSGCSGMHRTIVNNSSTINGNGSYSFDGECSWDYNHNAFGGKNTQSESIHYNNVTVTYSYDSSDNSSSSGYSGTKKTEGSHEQHDLIQGVILSRDSFDCSTSYTDDGLSLQNQVEGYRKQKKASGEWENSVFYDETVHYDGYHVDPQTGHVRFYRVPLDHRSYQASHAENPYGIATANGVPSSGGNENWNSLPEPKAPIALTKPNLPSTPPGKPNVAGNGGGDAEKRRGWSQWAKAKAKAAWEYGKAFVAEAKTAYGDNLDNVQVTLDVAGMIPVIGEAADGVNTVIYVARGDYSNAGLSAAAMVPIIGNGATGAKWAGKAGKVAAETADTLNDARKKIPNPNGSKGCQAHRDKIAEVKADMENRGLRVIQEKKIDTPGGIKDKRIPDLQGKDANGNIVEIHQIGRQKKDGLPVKREAEAMQDLEKPTGIKPKFHPYNP